MINYNNQLHPAYLWVGDHETLERESTSYLKNIFCKAQGCNTCFTCKQITHKQFHSIRWIKPQNNYILSDLEIIFSTVIYKLQESQHFFFVLDYAERLTLACANKLLKSLEEPLQGYHFILLTSSKQAIIPTIISRCVVQFFSQLPNIENKLFDFFRSPDITQSQKFIEYIESTKIAEQDIILILDNLENFWLKNYKQSLEAQDINIQKQSESLLQFIKEMRKHYPMPGSAKIALKNIFLYLLAL